MRQQTKNRTVKTNKEPNSLNQIQNILDDLGSLKQITGCLEDT
jgi:hypothetical protein